jgi:hypothetical protein
MKSLIIGSWNLVMGNRYNPLRYLDRASQHYFMQVLAWMWSMIFSLSFLSILQFHIVWLAHLLVVAGVFATIAVFKYGESRSINKAPVQNFSHASACVWQMDREA